MISAEDAELILRRLDEVVVMAGYSILNRPLVVSGVPFDVARAYAGGAGSIDLIVVLDATQDSSVDAERKYWLVERIARALDRAESRRPLTVIVLHDEEAAGINVDRLLRVARVLVVTDSLNLESEISPILPLDLDYGSDDESDLLKELEYGYSRDKYGSSLNEIFEAADRGTRQVERAFVRFIDRAFVDNAEYR